MRSRPPPHRRWSASRKSRTHRLTRSCWICAWRRHGRVLHRLRAQSAHRHTPVAIITGDSCIDDPAMIELHGLDAEVRFKPMWIDEVVQLTRMLLAKRRPNDPVLKDAS